VTLGTLTLFHASPTTFTTDPSNLEKIARVTGAKIDDIKTLLGGDFYPLAADQQATTIRNCH
jgi:ABC-type taurine transport system substrate-binding protein